MSYLVIDADGALRIRDGAATREAINQDVEGWVSAVRLRSVLGTVSGCVGWVEDCSLINPECVRNVIGGSVLVSLGGNHQPYAGPVVLTGWDPDGEHSEIADLDETQIAMLSKVHADVYEAIDGVGDGPWHAAIREYAQYCRTGDVPPIRILTPGDPDWPFASTPDGA